MDPLTQPHTAPQVFDTAKDGHTSLHGLVLPGTRGTPTRSERALGPEYTCKGLPELNIRDFCRRYGAHLTAERRGPTRKQRRVQKDLQDKQRDLRSFTPQNWTKVLREDVDARRQLLYLTLANGQVINVKRLLAKSKNPHLVGLTLRHIETRTSKEAVDG